MQAFHRLLDEAARRVDRMMNENYRCPAADGTVVEEAPKAEELGGTEAPRSNEGGLRDRGGKADDGERSAQPHERKATTEDAGVGQIARHIGGKFLEETFHQRRTERVGVVVSGNDADAIGGKSELLLEQRSHRDELATEGKIGSRSHLPALKGDSTGEDRPGRANANRRDELVSWGTRVGRGRVGAAEADCGRVGGEEVASERASQEGGRVAEASAANDGGAALARAVRIRQRAAAIAEAFVVDIEAVLDEFSNVSRQIVDTFRRSPRAKRADGREREVAVAVVPLLAREYAVICEAGVPIRSPGEAPSGDAPRGKLPFRLRRKPPSDPLAVGAPVVPSNVGYRKVGRVEARVAGRKARRNATPDGDAPPVLFHRNFTTVETEGGERDPVGDAFRSKPWRDAIAQIFHHFAPTERERTGHLFAAGAHHERAPLQEDLRRFRGAKCNDFARFTEVLYHDAPRKRSAASPLRLRERRLASAEGENRDGEGTRVRAPTHQSGQEA
ncbi:hypothetical protein OUZ56_032438 [Daphnia magna]|uniref:Uncharacterized protein n=1 Tax=Daphnia magna TaxID=35525 RepID=A0ABR0B9C2_9CRUS|nr:hypothetical protein OUZ56_032438 [Daphnia magna]